MNSVLLSKAITADKGDIMSSTRIVLLILLLVIISVHSVIATELPPPPKGYSWVSCNETKSAFLKPVGWYFKKGKKGDTWGYFITKELIDKEGSFTTGLTVNIMPDIPRKKGMSPTEYAEAYIREGTKYRKVVKSPWQNDMGPFHAYGVVLHNTDNKGGDFITHELAIGNDTTGTMYQIIFEAPAASWKAAWQVGEPILQRFLIDSDI